MPRAHNKHYSETVAECPYCRTTAVRKAIQACSRIANVRGSGFKQHLAACLSQIGDLDKVQDATGRDHFGEMEGEILAAQHMADAYPNLDMVVGYHTYGYRGFDQVWVGRERTHCAGAGLNCPCPVYIVEAKAQTAALSKTPRKTCGNASQMQPNWSYYSAKILASMPRSHFKPGKEHDGEYEAVVNLGKCIMNGIEGRCPKVYGLVFRGGDPYSCEDYKGYVRIEDLLKKQGVCCAIDYANTATISKPLN